MGSSGFSSPRPECFPAGLRVLVVDDDPTWLKILEKMLKKCNYEVTTCSLAREALNLLRERKDGFDIVISDVNMPDMDGFKLLEHVGLEMDLPVIMMSVDGETSRVMKGVQHGACDYLLKPIRMKELKNIWQHVFRKRIHEVRDVEEIHMLGNGTEPSDDGFLFSGDLISGRKRKGDDSKNDDTACSDPSSLKKTRVVWTVDLHQKFVRAVNHIGFDKVGPKKILDLMGVSWLSRENVASHLQKYRLYLSRLPIENEAKVTSGGIKNEDYSPKGLSANVCIQKPTENFHTSSDKTPILEGTSKGTLPMPTESKMSLFEDVLDLPKSSISFGFIDSNVKSSKFQSQFSWNAGSPSIQSKPERNRYFRPGQSFDPLHPILVDSMDPSQHYNKEPNKPIAVAKNQTGSIAKVTKVESIAALFSVQPQIHSTQFESAPQQNLFHGLEYSSGNNATFKLRDEEFSSFSSQSNDFHPPNIDFESAVTFDGFDQEIVAGIPLHMFDSVNFDYPSESVEYQALDQGLFIA